MVESTELLLWLNRIPYATGFSFDGKTIHLSYKDEKITVSPKIFLTELDARTIEAEHIFNMGKFQQSQIRITPEGHSEVLAYLKRKLEQDEEYQLYLRLKKKYENR
jgi:hypothetical protein